MSDGWGNGRADGCFEGDFDGWTARSIGFGLVGTRVGAAAGGDGHDCLAGVDVVDIMNVCTARVLDGEGTKTRGESKEARHGREGDCRVFHFCDRVFDATKECLGMW